MRVVVDKKKNEELKKDRKLQIDIFPENAEDVAILRELETKKAIENLFKKKLPI
jgi:hypothetical protein